ncbi:hypothetical protein ACTWQF_27385 [Streptomyces sp. 8N114]|uniref:hypothetical protein n=1 Tax=Streptomyces sp. 8N114 TaxID=3457419 RepID=UPI003FD0ECA6
MSGVGTPGWIRVPVGDDAARWATRGRCRRVLLVVHNVTCASRLLDVVPLFHDDVRVQLLLTCTGSSAFQAGVGELFAETGLPTVPWEQASATPVDLAVSASFGGQLHRIQGPLAILSHGVGYTKRLATAEQPNSRTAEQPNSPAPAPAPVFGLSPEWLLTDGSPLADALVLSHPEQVERLRAACPQAAHTAVLAGDPCFDRMLAARPYRERFRRALGVRRGQKLIVLNSTWNPEGLFGDGGDADVLPYLLSRLTSELPVDDYRLVAVLHPNIWHGHGPGQIRAWLDRARRRGLTLVDPLHGWRQALLGADAVIGDHGAVTFYAAALETPVLLGAAPLSGLAPDSPVAAFVRSAPRLDPSASLLTQLEKVLADHRPPLGPAEFTTSVPGESGALLRRLFYRMMRLPEPPWPALLEPLPLPSYEPPAPSAPLRVLTEPGTVRGEVSVRRLPDPPYEPAAGGVAHTAVHEDTRETGALGVADVIFRSGPLDDPRLGPPAEWTAEVLERYPHCSLAAYVTGPDSCLVRTRGGHFLALRAASAQGADPAAYASALHALLAPGKAPEELVGGVLRVRIGAAVHTVSVTPAEG